jgi:hypothetical protein
MSYVGQPAKSPRSDRCPLYLRNRTWLAFMSTGITARARDRSGEANVAEPWVSAESPAAVLWPYRSSSGSLAMFAAIRRASFRVSNPA